ncbi:PREDICTED: dynein-1-beta heavy chain, flagellar inner arm I1 complex-like [Dufourea novaeangliae]|uniref:dynein-1-beta heavy chain, flagellar inner arm I1 complex-like n=1 Tax=Dufourea novaeangliae TaxID=178035 RepID=UPI000767CB48|nr:PREDICTED: dynein-1-beta heavy chain, flagellar inner arm I1 complex-like [Dufourea novaeangliae]
MSSKKEQKLDGTKKSDKMVDTHREFLDMDTDEEDFGRQESPEVEEELPPEPEKPVFTEKDLLILVKYVKDLTVFPAFGDENWSENCDQIIREYFENPSHVLLTILQEGNKLTAILNFPKYASKGFMYFLRSPWQIYTAENFLDTVLFGSINGDIKSFVLKFMENVYAPIVLRTNEYTSFIKDEVFSNLHEFIIRLTKEIYEPKGLTTLYVPKENLLNKLLEPSTKIDCFLLGEDRKTILPEEDQRKRETVDRLEKIVWSWIVQIHDAAVTSSSRKNIECIQDEVNYWKAKHAETSITEALLLILYIWIEAPFYHTTSNIETLCKAFSSQIIFQCKNYIKLDVIFGNNPEEGKKLLEKCIFCCNIYKTIYDNLMTTVVLYINPNKKWDINATEVFKKMDTFKQRCYDVIEISEALLIFGRYTKIGLLGSPRGTEYEAYWREIENLFYESLNKITAARDTIFDITKFNWLKKICRFRYTIQQLENMVINLINDIFKNIKNIEDGIEAIYALHKLKKRDSLRILLQNKWLQVWKIFSNEIQYCYTYAINISKEYEQSIQKTDVNMDMSCISWYLNSQYTIMRNAADWIGDCAIEKCTMQQYKHVLHVIDERKKMFNTYSIHES